MTKSGTLLEHYLNQFSLHDVFSDKLVERLTLKTVKKGEAICKLGEPIGYFYLLVEGKLKIYALQENGKKILIRFYRPLNAIGDLEYLTDYPPNAIVEAIEESHLIAAPMDIIRSYTEECPVFLRFIVKQLSHKLYTYSKIASMNIVYPLENRVASYLWSMSKLSDNKQLEEIRVNSMEEMANLLGTSYRHLSRVLKNLEEKSILMRDRGNIKITDFNKLNDLSVGLFE